MRSFFLGLILIPILSQWSPCCSAQETFSKAEAVDAAVRAEMQRQNLVGVSIGIIQNSKIVYTKGYGSADLASRTPMTDETIVNWASNSKPVIAVAAMQLVQAGRLNLDRPIRTYLPNLPRHLQPITTRQLLCHQSGIPHYTNGRIVPSGVRVDPRKEVDPAVSLHRFLMSPLIYSPGSKSEYSSYAYVLLSAVVQAAGQQPMEKLLNTGIVKPTGMQTFQLDLPYQQQRNWTTAYKVINGNPVAVRDYAHFWKHGAGGYKSNVQDFARFAVALMNHQLIQPNTAATMWTQQKLRNGTVTSRGLGVTVSGSGNSLKVSHNGSQDETRTRMVIYPNRKHGVVVMCNTQGADPGKISTAIYTALSR